MKTLLEYGTPEEEAWRWKFVPWYVRYQRMNDSYLYTVKYYDKPEGEDLLGKVVAMNRHVLPYSLTVAVMSACMHTSVSGFQKRAGRFLHMFWPAQGAVTAFATAAYFGAKLRQKDD